MSTINGRKLNLIFVCLVMFLLVIMFTMFADAVPELKTSNLNGGKQYGLFNSLPPNGEKRRMSMRSV